MCAVRVEMACGLGGWTAAALLCLGRPESRSSISLRAAIGMRLSIWGLPWCTDVHYLGGVAYATHAPRLECAIGMTQVSLCRLSSRFRLSVRSHGLGRSPATPDQPRSGHAGATTATPVPTRQSSAVPRKPTASARHEVAGVGGHAWWPGPLGSPFRRTRSVVVAVLAGGVDARRHPVCA